MSDVSRLKRQFEDAQRQSVVAKSAMQAAVAAQASALKPDNVGLLVNQTGSGVKVTYQIPPGSRVLGYQAFGERATDRLGVAARESLETVIDRGLS